MPTVPATPWGHWGSPSPVNAWSEDGPLQLNGPTGGEIKPGYSDTLQWYYRRSKNPQDKEHCLKLLTKLELQKKNSVRRQQDFARPRRPQTAPRQVNVNQASHKKVILKPGFQSRPSSPSHRADKAKDLQTTYQQQLAASQRLSRPKTVKLHLDQETSTRAYAARPKSAMADLGRRRVTDPYLTTHQSDFPGYPSGNDAEAVRPMTSRGVINPSTNLKSHPTTTTFNEHFSWNPTPRAEPIRTGTSSGCRNNNPHPQEGFMVWRLARKNAEGQSAAPAKNRGYRELSHRMMEQILSDRMKSTYQSDFLGVPQGYQVKDAIDCPEDWRQKVPRPGETTSRVTYKNASQEPELVENTTRYGCNKRKSIPSLGAVPSVTRDHVKNQEGLKAKTTYSNFFEGSYKQDDLDKLLKQQDNQKVVNSFLKFARTQNPSYSAEKIM